MKRHVILSTREHVATSPLVAQPVITQLRPEQKAVGTWNSLVVAAFRWGGEKGTSGLFTPLAWGSLWASGLRTALKEDMTLMKRRQESHTFMCLCTPAPHTLPDSCKRIRHGTPRVQQD